MGDLKTLGLLLLLCLPVPLRAMPTDPQERTTVFATCAGRYAAVMEHAWLIGTHDMTATARREGFVELLNAVRPASGIAGAEVLDLRIRAKHALARTLQVADFHPDDTRRTRAAAEVQRRIRMCEMLLLT